MFFDGVLPVDQPVHRGVDLVGGRAGHPEIDPQGGVGPPRQRGQLAARAHHPRDDQRQHQIPGSARRTEQRRQAQLARHPRHRGHVPVRQRPGDGDLVAHRHQPLPLEARVNPVDDVLGQHRQVGYRLVAHPLALAVCAPQIRRGVLAWSALLVHVGLLHSDYVDLPADPRHKGQLNGFRTTNEADTPTILTTLLASIGRFPQLNTPTARISYRNFGLAADATAA